jgi:hypothetical protein
MSHIAYDVFVNAGASFPMLAPLIFSDFFIPQIYALPIEAAAILLVYLGYIILSKRVHGFSHGTEIRAQKHLR